MKGKINSKMCSQVDETQIDDSLFVKSATSKVSEINTKQQEQFACTELVYLPTIEGIATGSPNHIIPQSDAADFVANLPHIEQNRSRIHKLYENTRINTRRLAVNLISDEASSLISRDNPIQARMGLFEEHAVPLATMVAKKALVKAGGGDEDSPINPQILDQIGSVVFVSSTGFVAPGIDTYLIKNLGLRRDIARVTVNFMGCAAAMNGLRVACDYVRSHPHKKVLLVCLELSSVNAVFDDSINDVIIHSIFGDGCAAVVIGACEREQAIAQKKVLIHEHLSYLIEDTEDGIVLGVNDNGVTCTLSRYLPDYIRNGINPVIENFLVKFNLTKEQIDLWAVHPGGTKILENAQQALGLEDYQIADSWEILRQHGNMLSPSVLFVMERMLQRIEVTKLIGQNQACCCHSHKNGNECNHTGEHEIVEKGNQSANVRTDRPQTGLAFSFAPGVGIEGVLFQVY